MADSPRTSAASVLVVRGQDRMTYDMIEDAAADLQSGCSRMRERYIGLKDYDRFSSQREDHRYGFGPKHGHIVAEIGLTSGARQRPLTPEEVAAALRELDALAAVVPMTRRST